MEETIQSLNVKHLIVGAYATGDLPANAQNGSIFLDTTTNKLVVMLNGSYETITSA